MNEADLHIIEQYLDGRLTPAEVQKTEERLATDVDFARMLAQYRQQDNYLSYRAKGGLLPEDIDSLASEFWQAATAEAKTPDSAEPEKAATEATVRPLRRYLSIAAAIALLLTAGWWLTKASATLHGPDLYASHLVIPRIDNSSRGEVNPADSLYNAAVDSYAAGDYSSARPLMDRYLEDFELDSELLLAYAVASIEEGAYDEAAIALRRLAETDSLLAGEVPFYRALLYLRQGDVASARAVLEEVSGGDQKLQRLREALAN